MSIHTLFVVGWAPQKKKRNPSVDFASVNKGTYASTKSRGALMQVLFNQGSSEKINVNEVLSFHLLTEVLIIRTTILDRIKILETCWSRSVTDYHVHLLVHHRQLCIHIYI